MMIPPWAGTPLASSAATAFQDERKFPSPFDFNRHAQ
jgi:hypothetical protein